MTKNVKQVGIFLLTLFAIGALRAAVSSPTLSPEAQKTSQRNGFISGCKSEVVKNPSIANPEAVCGCAYDKLMVLYPDFDTNTDRTNRILKDGYNQAETDAIVPCVTNS